MDCFFSFPGLQICTLMLAIHGGKDNLGGLQILSSKVKSMTSSSVLTVTSQEASLPVGFAVLGNATSMPPTLRA